MSTRANIILKDGEKKLFFYRHSDGYPEGVMPTLNLFLSWMKEGKIRNNLTQSAGWLILIGAMEYNTIPEFKTAKPVFKGDKGGAEIDSITPPDYWKAGSYEPTTGIHGDVEYVYTIDLKELTIKQEKQ